MYWIYVVGRVVVWIYKRKSQNTLSLDLKVWDLGAWKVLLKEPFLALLFLPNLGWGMWVTWKASDKTDKLKWCPPEWYWQNKRLVSMLSFSAQNNQRPDEVSEHYHSWSKWHNFSYYTPSSINNFVTLFNDQILVVWKGWRQSTFLQNLSLWM